ncbi:esterase/lipase family protein [Glutamicibacter soli]|uniref:esterase/lipase family protein n=1 Tax=Glutamicibacter soli TaxID=453836 RepID=UPI003FD303DA
MKALKLIAAVSGLALSMTLLGAPAATATAVPQEWEKTCNVPGLDYAPVLDTDDQNDGADLTLAPNAAGFYVPVIYVHGWVSTSKNVAGKGVFSTVPDLAAKRAGGTPKLLRSLIGNVQDLPGAAVFTFDYQQYAARWVTDKNIGPALGQAISCLHDNSGQKVIVVGHSMGGLATRQAFSEVDGLDDKVSQVITFGTPNTGSVIAAAAATALTGASIIPGLTGEGVVLLRAWLAHCGRASSQNMLEPGTLCFNLLPPALTAFDSEAAKALRSGSAELKELADWPDGVPVHALSGDMRFDVAGTGFFGWKKKESFSMGDGVVTVGSAIDGAADSKKATCTYDLEPAANIRDGFATNFWKVKTYDEVSRNSVDLFTEAWPCFHSNLMRETSLANEQFVLIAADIETRFPPTDIVTIDPWKEDPPGEDPLLKADEVLSDGECFGPGLSGRSDSFRCSAQSYILDPCFANPNDPTKLLCVFPKSTILLTDMSTDSSSSAVGKDEGSAFMAVLHDGTVCTASSGAGPQGVEGYPYWFGSCQGPTEGIWRARADNPDPLTRLYDRTDNGTYFVAISVGDEQAPAQLFPVKTAYR